MERLEERQLLASFGQLADLAPTSNARILDTEPRPVLAGDHFYFVGEDVPGQEEVWLMDRDSAVARPLFESRYPSGTFPRFDYSSLTAVGDRLFFVGNGLEIPGSLQLHVTDETGEGVIQLSGPDGVNWVRMTSSQGAWLRGAATQAFFIGTTLQQRDQLWVSDGTVAGTIQLTDQTPLSGPQLFETVGDRLFFTRPGLSGTELWTSDGTVAGTNWVKDLPGFSFSSNRPPLVVGDKLLFWVNAGSSGTGGLWFSDGTTGGTGPLLPPESESLLHSIANLTVVGERLAFTLTDNGSTSLWFTDGTLAGTQQVYQGIDPAYKSRFSVLAVSDRLFFRFSEQVDGSVMDRLAVSDGTVAGTQRLTDFDGQILSAALYSFDNQLMLWRRQSVEVPWQLVITDGTAEGTTVIAEQVENPYLTKDFMAFEGRTFFRQNLSNSPQHRDQLWFTEGQSLQPVQIDRAGSIPDPIVAAGENLFMIADDGISDRQLWVSRADAAPVRLTQFDAHQGEYIADKMMAHQGNVYFVASTVDHGAELWVTDGTEQGTRMLDETLAGRGSVLHGVLFELWAVQDQIYLESHHKTWVSDGAAVTLLADSNFQLPRNHVVSGDHVFFTATDDAHGRELWVGDPAGGQSQLVVDLVPGSDDSFIRNLTPFAGGVLFIHESSQSSSQQQVWFSDGTFLGTRVLAGEVSEGNRSFWDGIFAGESLAYFFGSQVQAGSDPIRRLWVTDGTVDGTAPVATHAPFEVYAGTIPAMIGDQLYFAANEPGTPVVLWTSDGTAAGTRRVQAGVADEAVAYGPADLTVFADKIVFSAYHMSQGAELWSSDGTAEGTVLVADVRPGLMSSTPRQLTVVGDRVYFSALEDYDGLEVWWYSDLDLIAPGIVLTESNGSTFAGSESLRDSFELSLAARPQSPVTLLIDTSRLGAVTAVPSAIVFTPKNWDQPQSVELIAPADWSWTGEPRQQMQIVVSPETTAAGYADLAPLSHSVTILATAASGIALRIDQATATIVDPATDTILTQSALIDEALVDMDAFADFPAVDRMELSNHRPYALQLSADAVVRMTAGRGPLLVSMDANGSLAAGEGWQIEPVAEGQSPYQHRLSLGEAVILLENGSPLTNPLRRGDVDHNGETSAADALMIINHLFRRSRGDGEESIAAARQYYDVSGDNQVSAKDALQVINSLSRQLDSEVSARQAFYGVELTKERKTKMQPFLHDDHAGLDSTMR
jgi:ELWxxDGT repeat protein